MMMDNLRRYLSKLLGLVLLLILFVSLLMFVSLNHEINTYVKFFSYLIFIPLITVSLIDICNFIIFREVSYDDNSCEFKTIFGSILFIKGNTYKIIRINVLKIFLVSNKERKVMILPRFIHGIDSIDFFYKDENIKVPIITQERFLRPINYFLFPLSTIFLLKMIDVIQNEPQLDLVNTSIFSVAFISPYVLLLFPKKLLIDSEKLVFNDGIRKEKILMKDIKSCTRKRYSIFVEGSFEKYEIKENRSLPAILLERIIIKNSCLNN